MGFVETLKMGLVETCNITLVGGNIDWVSRNMFQLAPIHDQVCLGPYGTNSTTPPYLV